MPYALVGGVPAKQMGWVCECGLTLTFAAYQSLCICGREYTMVGETAIEKTGEEG